VSESTRLKNEALDRARALAAKARSAERGLDNAPSVARAYEQAGQATEPLEASTPGPPQRTTSFAKSLDEPSREAANDHEQKETGQGSQMVEKDRPELKPVNKTPEAKAVNRDQFNKDWSAEQARGDVDIERAKETAAKARAAEVEAAQEREQDRDMGMG